MMTTTDPHTLPEWKAYIDTLDGEVLFRKVERANSITFVKSLKADGLDNRSIKTVFEYFVRRLLDCDELPPAGGYYDLRKMMDELGLTDREG